MYLCAINSNYVEDLCDNIGLVLVCLPSGSTDVAGSPSQYMIQPSGIPILSPVLFMHVGDPYIPKFEEFLIYLLIYWLFHAITFEWKVF